MPLPNKEPDIYEFEHNYAFYGQPLWYLFDEMGKEYNSFSTRWNDHTSLAIGREYCEQGIVYPLTTMNITRCLILPEGQQTPVEILPPVPLPFFSFARYGLPLYPGTAMQDISPRWLYSLFGFFFDDYRFTWKLSRDDTTSITIQSRTIPLAL